MSKITKVRPILEKNAAKIFRMYRSGFSVKQIAYELQLNYNPVYNFIAQARAKGEALPTKRENLLACAKAIHGYLAQGFTHRDTAEAMGMTEAQVGSVVRYTRTAHNLIPPPRPLAERHPVTIPPRAPNGRFVRMPRASGA